MIGRTVSHYRILEKLGPDFDVVPLDVFLTMAGKDPTFKERHPGRAVAGGHGADQRLQEDRLPDGLRRRRDQGGPEGRRVEEVPRAGNLLAVDQVQDVRAVCDRLEG